MPAPIRKLYILKRFTEAYYRLSPSERDAITLSIFPKDLDTGAHSLITCKARWCDEGVAEWGVVDYPNAQGVMKEVDHHEKTYLYRYADTQTYLGVGGETWNETVDLPNPIYQLFMIHNGHNEPYAALTQEARDALGKRMMDSLKEHGGQPMFWSSIYWSNEEYANFGITAWPSLEAEQAHFRDLEKINWHRYVYARTILGTRA